MLQTAQIKISVIILWDFMFTELSSGALGHLVEWTNAMEIKEK